MPRIRRFGYRRKKINSQKTPYAKKNDANTDIPPPPPPPPTLLECRACMNKFDDAEELLDLFQPWETPWDGMGDTIAQDLTQIAHINISQTDYFTKLICHCCYEKLLESCSFVASVRARDKMLRGVVETADNDSDWSKLVEENQIIKTEATETPEEADIKQEVPDQEAYTITVEETIKGAKESECIKTYTYFEVKAEPEEIPSPPDHSVDESNMQDEVEDSSNVMICNHKPIKVPQQFDEATENLQAVAMLIKKEFNEDEREKFRDFNPYNRIHEGTPSDSIPSAQTTQGMDVTETE